MNHFGYTTADFIPCEVCGAPAVDIHHAKPKSLGGGDNIENTIALCRNDHIKAHDGTLSREQLLAIHMRFI